jgi:hypothetical protein
MFLTVMIVFIAAYAVPATALMNKHVDTFYWGIFWDLFNVGIWDVFGELNGDAKNGVVSVHMAHLHAPLSTFRPTPTHAPTIHRRQRSHGTAHCASIPCH